MMIEQKATYIRWHAGAVTRRERERLNGHAGFTLWFTGLSASGKSTLAVATEEALYRRGCRTYILDGIIFDMVSIKTWAFLRKIAKKIFVA
jgi:adenylylsulfate kinase